MSARLVAVVQSLAGHDKGELFCVLKQEERLVFLADGRRRKIMSPKRKNLGHVEFLSHSTGKHMMSYPQSDKELRRALAALKEVMTLGKR